MACLHLIYDCGKWKSVNMSNKLEQSCIYIYKKELHPRTSLPIINIPSFNRMTTKLVADNTKAFLRASKLYYILGEEEASLKLGFYMLTIL